MKSVNSSNKTLYLKDKNSDLINHNYGQPTSFISFEKIKTPPFQNYMKQTNGNSQVSCLIEAIPMNNSYSLNSLQKQINKKNQASCSKKAISTKGSPSLNSLQTIIIDIGNYFIRAGTLKNKPSLPEVCLQSSVVIQNTQLSIGKENFNSVSLKTADKPMKNSEILFPLREKNIARSFENRCFSQESLIIREVFEKLQINPKNSKLLLCLPTRASSFRPYFISALFSDFHVPAVATISAFRSYLQTSKSSTCLIINFNHDLEIIPVVNGALIESGRVIGSRFGENLIQIMLSTLEKHGLSFTNDEAVCFGPLLFKKISFVQNENEECKEIEINLSEIIPQSQTMKKIFDVALRTEFTEEIFKPNKRRNLEYNALSLKKLIRWSLERIPEYRNELCANVQIVGEFANLEGLTSRITSEMRLLSHKNTKIKVTTIPNSAEAGFIGGCLTSAIMQGSKIPDCKWFKYISKARYEKIRTENHSQMLQKLNDECIWP